MLVLTRLKNEKIMIGNDIVITVVDIMGGGRIRLGIEAPKEIPIHREEAKNKEVKNKETDEIILEK